MLGGLVTYKLSFIYIDLLEESFHIFLFESDSISSFDLRLLIPSAEVRESNILFRMAGHFNLVPFISLRAVLASRP